MAGQRDISPYFLKCVLPPPQFFGVRHFCTNARGIRWMIGAIFVKFSQLILVKIIEIVAAGCQIIRLKCTNSILAEAPPQTLLGEPTPQTSRWIQGAYL